RRAARHPHHPWGRLRPARADRRCGGGHVMTFRTRLTLVATTAVAAAVVLASAVIYVFIRGELRGEVDQALLTRVESISYDEGIQFPGGFPVLIVKPPVGEPSGYVQ